MADHAQLQPVLLWAAFWIGVLGRGSRRVEAGLGLILGAGLAHLGWALLHPEHVAALPIRLLDPRTGYTLLLLPLGPLLIAALRARGAARGRAVDAALRALPPALALARAGCVVAGCCGGRPLGDAPGAPLLPVQWIELAGWVGVAWLLARIPRRLTGPAFCALFGGLRLLLEPLRAAPPLGEPLLSPAWLALAWLIGGLVWGGLRVARADYSGCAS